MPLAGCNRGNFGVAFGQSSGLVDDQGVDLFEAFKSLGVLYEHPSLAPRPTPTMMDIGVARPSAQGQAMIRTATAAMRPCANRGSGPTSIQINEGQDGDRDHHGDEPAGHFVRKPLNGSADRCASATILTIWDSMVSRPTLPASMMKPPVWVHGTPDQVAPTALVTGIDSPVIIDSSTELRPSSIVPSTGTFSPGRTLSLSPTATASSPMSSSVPSAFNASRDFRCQIKQRPGLRHPSARAPEARAPGRAAPEP